jgi:hypothetical protein
VEAEEKPVPPIRERGEIHPVETLIKGLVDPTIDEMTRRAQEYERYVPILTTTDVRYLHYHADELNSSDMLVEEKDLQLYIRAAQLARGEDVERILQSEYEKSQQSMKDLDGIAREQGEGSGSNDNNVAFYENYLKTTYG